MFDSPRVKQNLIYSKRNFSYELPQNITTGWRNILEPSLPYKTENLTLVVKTYAKADIKAF